MKWWEKFGAHPALNLWGLGIGVVSAILGIVFYLASIEKPELCFYVHPKRSTVLKAGQTTNLRVLWKENEITNDLTVVQVQLWNRGKRAIHGTDILQPIAIHLAAPIRSMEVTIDPAATNAVFQGIQLKWQILEKDDACIVQIIYEGVAAVPVNVTGVIEGQRLISQPKVSAKPRPPLNIHFAWTVSVCGWIFRVVF